MSFCFFFFSFFNQKRIGKKKKKKKKKIVFFGFSNELPGSYAEKKARKKQKDGAIIISEKSLNAFLKPFDSFHVKQMLLAEVFLQERTDPKSKKTVIVIPRDRIWSFLRSSAALSFCRNMLVAERFALLSEIARLAYRADDVDVPGLIVDLLSEQELLDLVGLLVEKRGTETNFRADGIDTSLVARWALTSCTSMLDFLPEVIQSVLALPDGFELDPTKIRHSSLMNGNIRNVETVCKSILTEVTSRPNLLPPFLKALLSLLKANGVDWEGVSSVVILRIISPAIISPDRFHLIDHGLLPTQRRGLLMIAKVLQQIANGIEFESDHFLSVLNPLIVENHKLLIEFLSGLITADAPPILQSQKPLNVQALRQFLLRVPVYADDALINMQHGSNAMVFAGSNLGAVRFRLLFRFSLKRQSRFLSDEDETDSMDDSSSGEVASTPTTSSVSSAASSAEAGSSTPVIGRMGIAKLASVYESEAEANEKLTPTQMGIITAVNGALEQKRILFTFEFLCAGARAAEFKAKRAIKILSAYHNYYKKEVNGPRILISDVESMVLDGVLLVHPKLVSTAGLRVMLMRPARYFPSKTPTSDVIKLLSYMTQRLVEDVGAQINGFTFVADLGTWKMENFSRSYAMTWFLSMLVMPVKLESFIIIDAPSWFGAIWAVIKHAMSRSFQSKWSYVTRATLDTVLTKAHRPPDLENGELDIDLAKWCEDRRVAESAIKVDPVFRQMGEPVKVPTRKASSNKGDTVFGSRASRRPSLVTVGGNASAGSSANSPKIASPIGSSSNSPNNSPRRRKPSMEGGLLVTESDESDSSVDMALNELQTFGIDNVEYSNTRKATLRSIDKGKDEVSNIESLQDEVELGKEGKKKKKKKKKRFVLPLVFSSSLCCFSTST